MEQFVRPTDPKQWYLDSCCSSGTVDGKEICDFCGEEGEMCAELCTESIKESHELRCGGSGFWCPQCGEFYANDTCGETFWVQEGILETRDGFAYCKCGAKLYGVEGELG